MRPFSPTSCQTPCRLGRVTRHERLFFSLYTLVLCSYSSGTPFPWRVVALIPQSPFGGRATARGYTMPMSTPSQAQICKVNSVLFFANWLAVNFFYFPNWEFFQNELIQFFNSFFFLSLSYPPPSLPSQV